MLKAILKDDRVGDVQGFSYGGWLDRKGVESLVFGEGGNGGGGSILRFAAENLPYKRELAYAYMRFRYKKRFFKLKDYVYWEPNYSPLFVTPKTIVSIYDLSHVRYPAFHGAARVRALHGGIKKALDGGAKIATISEFSKEEIASVYGVSKDSIVIAPPGVDARFCKQTNEQIERVKAKYAIDGEYILSVCTIEPRKNLLRLIEAFASLTKEQRGGCRLVLVGKNGWLEGELQKIAAPLEKSGELMRIGYVKDEDLPALYSGAKVFAYLSLYEGYGMPIAEAIKCKVKTLASNKEPMTSVGGGAAIYADPNDASDIADKMRAIINGEFAPIDNKIPQIFYWSECADMLVGAFLDMDKKEGSC